jgi:hypothetical protein
MLPKIYNSLESTITEVNAFSPHTLTSVIMDLGYVTNLRKHLVYDFVAELGDEVLEYVS